MRHIISVWFMCVILAGCGDFEKKPSTPVTKPLTEEQQYKQWEKSVLVVGTRWYGPPVWEYRAVMTEANREFTKYKVNPTCDGYYYVTVRDGVVTDIWSTLNTR